MSETPLRPDNCGGCGLPAPCDTRPECLEKVREIVTGLKAREIVYVDIKIELVPTVVLGQCPCGIEHRTDDPATLRTARLRGAELPGVECDCGRVVYGRKKIVRLAQ